MVQLCANLEVVISTTIMVLLGARVGIVFHTNKAALKEGCCKMLYFVMFLFKILLIFGEYPLSITRKQNKLGHTCSVIGITTNLTSIRFFMF